MARAAVTPLKTVSPYGPGPGAGIAAKAADAAEFNSFANDGRTWLVANNTNAATKTLKFKSSDGTQIGPTYTLPAEKTVVIGPFPVFEQFGSTVLIDANHANVTFVVVTIPLGVSALR